MVDGAGCKQMEKDKESNTQTKTDKKRHTKGEFKHKQRELTLGKSDAISVTAEWIFSEHGTKLRKREINYLTWQPTQRLRQ